MSSSQNRTNVGSNADDKKLSSSAAQNWRSNVFVEFDVNPCNLITFGEDENKRIVVSETKNGLEFIKGLPLLAVGKRIVHQMDCRNFEEALAAHDLPLVLRFGSKLLDLDQVIGDDAQSLDFEKTVSFLHLKEGGKRETEIFDVELPEIKISDEENADDVSELQPISFEGTHGDKQSWSKQCRARANIITTLLDTEKTYIKALDELTKFLKPCMKPLGKKANVDITGFHQRITNLIKLHDQIYEKFCTTDNICKAFQEDLSYMRMYKQHVRDYELTFAKLKGVIARRVLSRMFKRVHGKSSDALEYFNDLAITIVQRPPRYQLILKDLKKNTPVKHPMYPDLKEGLVQIEGICRDINEYQQQARNEIELAEVAKSIDSKSLREQGVQQLILPHRRLIRTGSVGVEVIKQSKWPLRRTTQGGLNLEMGFVVMCNDILIIMYLKKNRVLRVFPSEEMRAVVNKEPKIAFTQKKSTEVFEVALKKNFTLSTSTTDREESKYRGKHVRSKTTSTASDIVESLNSFSIYTSTFTEAKEWEKSLQLASFSQ